MSGLKQATIQIVLTVANNTVAARTDSLVEDSEQKSEECWPKSI